MRTDRCWGGKSSLPSQCLRGEAPETLKRVGAILIEPAEDALFEDAEGLPMLRMRSTVFLSSILVPLQRTSHLPDSDVRISAQFF